MNEYHILNLGAGVQSTALYLMFMDGDIEGLKLDAAIFADTQDEPKSVYKHLKWLKSLGGPEIITDTVGRLGDDIISGRKESGRKFASIPAFTAEKPGENKGLIRRQCTAVYKIEVVERAIRRQIIGLRHGQRMPPGIKVIQYFGLSRDEPKRVARTRNRFVGHPWAECRFPLFDDEMDRGDCVAYLESKSIPHVVPRSACVFCPFRSNAEWKNLRDTDPIGWSRAVIIDNLIRVKGSACNEGLDQSLYLHRQCIPLASVNLDEKDHSQGVADGECEGMCGS